MHINSMSSCSCCTHVVLLPDLDGRCVVVGLVGRPQEVHPDVPEAGLGAATLPEEVAAVEVEVVADPHDLPREVVGVHDEVGPVSRMNWLIIWLNFRVKS